MESVIVTATNPTKSFLYDLELPTDVAVDRLRRDIAEALNGYNPDLFLRAGATELFCNRIGRRLRRDETLESAGVWNGDYITIIEV